MSTQFLSLPVNIPWKRLAVSTDMVDRAPRDPAPDPWQSSLAIFAYEPKPEDIDPELCDQRLTFLKITGSITGIQHKRADEDAIRDYNREADSDGQRSVLEEIAAEYFACYGVLVRVSVFPRMGKNVLFKDVPLSDYPHIADYEPKRRDLYQSATQHGEILTASRTETRTDKSLTSTDSTETGVASSVEVPLGDPTSGVAPTGKAGATHKWGSVEQDAQAVSADASRERRETTGTTTNLSQMYNLLTAYHAGTNRAVFFVQPRPHTLQPTDKRTFVNGLREIEGQQDFFLIVSRPKHVPGICVEVQLETGHFGETAPNVPIEGAFEFKTTKIDVYQPIGANFGEQTKENVNFQSSVLEKDGWEFDPDKDANGHGSVTQKINDNDNSHFEKNHEGTLVYRTEDDGRLHVSLTIIAHGPWNPVARSLVDFDRTYTVYLRRRTSEGPTTQTDRTQLIITQRTLNTCFGVDDKSGCLQTLSEPRDQRLDPPSVEGPVNDDRIPDDLKIVAEYDFPWVDPVAGAGFDPRRWYRRLQARMAMPAMRARSAQPLSLLDTDYVTTRLAATLPPEHLDKTLDAISPDAAGRLGKDAKVGDVLKLPLRELARRTGLSNQDAAALRRQVLGVKREPRRTK
ncbi:MAG: hypothetical protein ACREQZ_13745 [Woeseiaceae bacterium]